MRKLTFFLACLFLIGVGLVNAQTRSITGKVVSAEDGEPIIGASVMVKGTQSGTITDGNGVFKVSLPTNANMLVVSYVGMKTQEVEAKYNITIRLESDTKLIDEVVVTALGIKRDKKALGYSVQEISNDINNVKESNIVNAISGKVSGVQIKQSSTMGGSANILIRGNKSFLGNNQALFVIDGVAFDNSRTNTTNQVEGWGGYDYGNAASDINSEDIESVSVLKGAAASALYGSRAANGVVLITTKKGKAQKGVGVSVNSGILFTSADKSTLPKIQKEYGGGYGQYYDDPSGYFFYEDVDGDGTPDLVVPTSEDASWGAKFDENLKVVDWIGLDPLDKTNFGRKVPWVAAKHDIRDFFETGIKFNNNIALTGGNDKGNYRVSYTNMSETGIMPNSKMSKNTINFVGSYNFTPKFSVESNITYNVDDNVGRYGTGYDPGNPMQSLGQWFQTNVDILDMKNYYKSANGTQRTWNYSYVDDLSPIYHNNIYWTRLVNYENDGRNRLFGYMNAKYSILPWMSIEGRLSTDFYSEMQEERVEQGSNQTSEYNKYLKNFVENNADLMLKANKTFGAVSTNLLLGFNSRTSRMQSTFASTVGGLQTPGFFNLMNSKSPITTTEADEILGVNSIYGNLSLGYNNMYYLDLTGRYDQMSTIKDPYFYPSVSGSFILSELEALKDVKALTFAKLRLNYAEVGNGAPVYSTKNTYNKYANWNSLPIYSLSTVLKNPDLKAERTKSWETGIEASFLQKRISFDLSLYKTNSVDQIMPVNISTASGYDQRYVNSGEIENKGIELSLNLVPVKSKDFNWSVQFNWSKNNNKVVSLYENVDNILLTDMWDVSLNLAKGQPYGLLRGTNFVYTNGKRTVDADGYYLYELNADGSKKTDCELGSVLPNWTGGVSTTLNYKGISVYALIDISMGGKVYSADQKYGVATGLFAETAGLNAKGNPKRDPVEDGGGILYDAVYEDGTPNTSYIWAGDWDGGWLYDYIPTAAYVYDASFVKLRELSVTYSLPSKLLKKTPFTDISASMVGRNLWLIYKNTPYFDPETSQSAGNIQGLANGAYPSSKTLGFNLSFKF
jgi:TonB-linked SusC/RagA family outer membrane protein